jgi:hypothetical protein
MAGVPRAYPERIYLPERGQSEDASAQPSELVAGLAGYGVPVELIDCELSADDAVISALGPRAAVP